MNHIEMIIKRECRGFIGDEPSCCFTEKELRSLLQEVVEPFAKDAERWRAFVRMDVDVHINTCGESFCGLGFAETGLTDFVDTAIAAAEEK